jgi:hypothetical protein
MGETRGDPPDDHATRHPRRGVVDALANARRRAALSAVTTRAGPVPDSALTEAVWAAENDGATETAPDAELERLRIELHHCHLPKLEAAGLIVRTDGRVETGPVEHDLTVNAPWSDGFDRRLDHPNRRDAVDALEAVDGPTSLSALAATLAADGSRERQLELELALHHVHLPTLDRMGVVRYDPDHKRVELGECAPRPTTDD